MSGRGARPRKVRLEPVWRTEINRDALARALLILVLSLDEATDVPHKKAQERTASPSAVHHEKGGGSNGKE